MSLGDLRFVTGVGDKKLASFGDKIISHIGDMA